MSKLLLIDGHSILTRAFFGVPDLTNSKGMHTNAVFGFLNIMFKILEEEKPDNIIVAFDVKAPTFRHEIFEAYKGTRKPMPNELHEQVPIIKEVLESMNIKIIEKAGYEADDILGTLSKDAKNKGFQVVIISGDRDLLQLAEDDILIRIPKTKKGGTEIENYYAKDVIEKYQVTPTEFIDLKALMGDTSDNIPGVKSVGEKTATKLITEYKSIENLYENIDTVKPERVKNALIADKDNANLSKVLATINTNVPLENFVESGEVKEIFNENAYKLFCQLEFKSLLSKFNNETKDTNEDANISSMIIEISKINEIDDLKEELKGFNEYIGLTYHFFEELSIHCLSIALDNKIYFIESGSGVSEKDIDNLFEYIRQHCKISVFNLKTLLHKVNIDFNIDDSIMDCMISAYLLNPLKDSYNYSDVARDYLGLILESKEEIAGKMSLFQLYSIDKSKLIMLLSSESYVAMKSASILTKRLEETEMLDLYKNIEHPLIFVLYEIEKNGILIDVMDLKDYSNTLQDIITKIEKEIHDEIGEEFNINSPKQLGEILFGKMGIPGGKKTKTGYSTSAEVLEKLAPEYAVINKILEYRQLTKLKSTYADGLTNFSGYDDRIHGKFNQTITATGRISSTEPNLQNIPIRMEMGKRFRKVFIPMEGYTLIDADYSQIELRILAHMSNDKNLIEAYNSDQDIHRITAAKVFHTPLEEVTDEMRSNAKAVNFGIVYGISSFGLSQDLSISRKEAGEYIKQYFETYPAVKEFLDSSVDFAKENGYAVTLFGRRRPIPELKSSNFMQRSFGERAAMNSVIQGTAADIIKIAMINVYKELKSQGLKSRLILQVHDELLIEAELSEVEKVKKIVNNAMMSAADLKVVLDIGLGQGNNWLEAH